MAVTTQIRIQYMHAATAVNNKATSKKTNKKTKPSKVGEIYCSNETTFLPYPFYRPSGSSSTVGCNGVARSIGSLSSLSSPNTSFSVGAGAGAGRDPSISRSASSRALDAASSARNLMHSSSMSNTRRKVCLEVVLEGPWLLTGGGASC